MILLQMKYEKYFLVCQINQAKKMLFNKFKT